MAPANFQKPLKLLACRSSNHEPCSMKKSVLRNFAKFTGKNLCEGLSSVFSRVWTEYGDLRGKFPYSFQKN